MKLAVLCYTSYPIKVVLKTFFCIIPRRNLSGFPVCAKAALFIRKMKNKKNRAIRIAFISRFSNDTLTSRNKLLSLTRLLHYYNIAFKAKVDVEINHWFYLSNTVWILNNLLQRETAVRSLPMFAHASFLCYFLFMVLKWFQNVCRSEIFWDFSALDDVRHGESWVCSITSSFYKA